MSAQDWSRTHRKGRFKGAVDANTIPIGTVVTYYGGEVREGKSAAVRCCLHNDSRRSAVMNTQDNLYFCHTCGKGGNAVNIISIIEEMDFKDALAKALTIIDGSGTQIRRQHKSRNSGVSRRSWDL